MALTGSLELTGELLASENAEVRGQGVGGSLRQYLAATSVHDAHQIQEPPGRRQVCVDILQERGV